MSLLLALAAVATAAADQPPARPVSASARATATIRIVSGAVVRFTEVEKTTPDSLRDTQVRSSDGSVRAVRVLEFQ